MPTDAEKAAEAAAQLDKMAAAAAAAVMAKMKGDAEAMSPALLSMMDAQMSTFSGEEGEDAVAHYLKFEDHMKELIEAAGPRSNMADDVVKIRKFKKTLSGKARKWFDRIITPATIAALKKTFLDKYSKDPTRTEDLMTMSQNKMKPNETVQQFGERISESMARLECCNEMIKDFFLLGLPHETAMWVRTKDPETFELAFEAAKEYTKLGNLPTVNPGAGLSVQFNVQEQDTLEQLVKEVRDLRAMNVQNVQNTLRSRPQSPYPNKGNLRARSFSPQRVRIEDYSQSASGRRSDYKADERRQSPERRGWSQENRGRSPYRQGWSPNRQQGRGWSPNRGGNYQREGNFQGQRGRSPQRWNNNNQNWGNRPQSPYRAQQRGRSPYRGGMSPSRPLSGPSPPQGQCWNCGRTGHYYRNCTVGRQEPTFQRKTERQAMRAFLNNIGEENQ